VTTAPLLAPAATPALAAGWPASLQLLLGEGALDLWSAAISPSGAALRSLRATSVSLRADGSATVQYAAELTDAAGEPLPDTLAATTGSRIPPGAAVLSDGAGTDVGLWRWPHDPALPALRRATTATAVRRWLPALGVPAADARLRLRAHRPGRRAVVEVTGAAGRWFLKVVRPADLPGLVARHRLLAGHVPVPEVLATTEDGVLVLPALAGTPMRAVLDDPAARPGAAVLTGLLDRLPTADLPRVRGPVERAAGHATVLGLVTPHLRPRLAALTAALTSADLGQHDVVPVHGDLYEAQLLLGGGGVCGLLDVDGLGSGHRIDDLANLLGHLAVLGHDDYRHELAAALPWAPAELAPRVAAVVLGLATGPFRVQSPGWPRATEARLALAERIAAGG
jgi:aminoglycoside phosphotransferase